MSDSQPKINRRFSELHQIEDKLDRDAAIQNHLFAISAGFWLDSNVYYRRKYNAHKTNVS